MKKFLFLIIVLLLSFAVFPALAETITEEYAARAMLDKVLQEHPEYTEAELVMRHLNYMPANPEYDQDFDLWTADIFRESDDFRLFHVICHRYHNDILPEDIRYQYYDPENWTNIIWHWEEKVNMGPIRCWPIEYKAEFDAWMRSSIADESEIMYDTYASIFLSHVNGLPDENCLSLEEAVQAARDFTAASENIPAENLLLRRTLHQFWVDDPENPCWCITICRNEHTFLRDYLVRVDAHTGECQWMHVDEHGFYQLGATP